MVLELQLGAVSLLAAIPIAVEEKDQFVKERPHPETARGSVGMEAPPKVSKAVQSKEASATTSGVVDVVMIIATMELWAVVGGVNIEIGVQFLRTNTKVASTGNRSGGKRVAQEGRRR